MKKIIIILGLLILSMTILSSCEGEKSKKKKDNKQDKYEKGIKDPCDILDYSIEIFEALDELSDKYDDIDDLEDDEKDKEKVKTYFDDLENAWKYAFKIFDAEEMNEVLGQECKNDGEVEESIEEIKDFYEDRVEDFIEFVGAEMQDLKGDNDGRAQQKKDGRRQVEAVVDEVDSYDYKKESQFMEEFMRECTSNNDYTENEMYDYCDCALEELMYEYTIDQMDYLENDEAIDFIKYNTDCLELMGYDEDLHEGHNH